MTYLREGRVYLGIDVKRETMTVSSKTVFKDISSTSRAPPIHCYLTSLYCIIQEMIILNVCKTFLPYFKSITKQNFDAFQDFSSLFEQITQIHICF